MAKVEKIRPWLHRIHTLKPNRTEAEQLCGFTIAGPDTWPMAAAWFHRAGVQRLFLSLGDQGIFYSDGECQGHLPVLGSPVVNVTGGGDAFMAGLAHAWLLEQGIMEAKSADTFKPEGWTPKFNVIETWNKAFPKQ